MLIQAAAERIATCPQDRGSFNARLPRGITVIPTQVCMLALSHTHTLRAACVCLCTGSPHGTLPPPIIHIFLYAPFTLVLIRAQYSKANGVIEGAPLLVELP